MALWFETALVAGEWRDGVRITHRDGVIVAVDQSPPEAHDERGTIAVPGLGNVHSHAFQRGMAGLAERCEAGGDEADSFWTWRKVMYGFLERLGPEDVEAIAAMAYVEMLECGFTRVGEFHYLHHDPDGRPYDDPAEMATRVAAAADATGVALTLLPVFYAHGGFGGAPPSAGQRRFVNDVDDFADLRAACRRAVARLDGGVVGWAPHSLRAATPPQIRRLASDDGGGPVHIHVAEQPAEVADCVAAHGARPVDWLMDAVGVDDRWCLVHATHVSATEVDRIGRSGAVVGLCPITEANLGDGLFPARAFLATGGRIAIGSDSNVLIDAQEELRLLEYGQRLRDGMRGRLAGDERRSVGGRLFREAFAGGAAALGTPRGDIAAGRPLDLVSLDGAHPSLAGRRGDALLDGWIFAARGGAVDGVWRAGRKLVSGGRHHAREAVAARYRRRLRDLLAS